MTSKTIISQHLGLRFGVGTPSGVTSDRPCLGVGLGGRVCVEAAQCGRHDPDAVWTGQRPMHLPRVEGCACHYRTQKGGA